MKAPPPVPRRQSDLGAATLTIVLCLLLIDAAVETFVSGAPVRWWVAGVAAAFLSLIAGVLWRGPANRFGWSSRATASLFVLLGLLAGTVWLRDGLTNGIIMLWQPTSIILSAVSALAVAGAGLVLVRVRFLPGWGRAALGLLALYGVAAIVVGIIEGMPYPNLFQGESLWRRLPYWLQGAFIGTLVAVPLAMVAAIVDAFRRLRAADGRGWGLQQSLALGLATLMAVSGFTMNGGPASGVAGPRRAGPQLSAGEITKPLDDTYRELSRMLSGQKEGQPRSPQEVAQQLEQLFPALEAAAKQIPRDTFDMAAVVQKVGRDPVKLFEWVRDETYLVPYRGLLRGHTGVLMDRLGNSLDRAVLLYTMLGSIGQTARLATGELTDEQARTLLWKARPVPPDGIPALAGPSADTTEAVLRAYAQEQHLDAAAVRKAMDMLAVEQQRVREAVENRVTQQTATIARAIGIPLRNEAEESATRIQGVKEHWWVEWLNGSTWTAFDPSLPDAASGQTVIAATRTFSPKNLRELGAERLHSIRLRVMIETWNRGKVSEAAVLTRDLFPAELIGKSIVLRFVPVAWPPDLNLFQEKDALAKLKATVLAQSEWLPILQIDGQNISRYTFNDYGDFGDTTLPGYAQAALAGRILVHKTEEAVEGLGNKIGGLLGGSRKDPTVPPPSRKQVTAVWIDYQLNSPGQAARIVRRDILDVLGPAARSLNPAPAPTMTEFQRLERGLALMGETDILPLVGDLSSQFVEHLAVKALLAIRDVLLQVNQNSGSQDTTLASNQLSKLSRMPFRLLSLALARRDWTRFGGYTYLDHSNILSYHRRPRANAKGDVGFRQGFDIVANDVAVRQQLVSDPFWARLEQGVLDTNAEALLAGGSCPAGSARTRCGPIENTAELFARAAQQKTRWLTIRSIEDASWKNLESSEDVRQRIIQDLTAGDSVIVPAKAAGVDNQNSSAWWRVNPRTGATLGISDRGWGQSTSEYMHFISAGVGGAAGVMNYVWCIGNLPDSRPVSTGSSGTKKLSCFICGLVSGLIWAMTIASIGVTGVLTPIQAARAFGIEAVCGFLGSDYVE